MDVSVGFSSDERMECSSASDDSWCDDSVVVCAVTMNCTARVPLLTKPLHLQLKPSGPFSLRSSSMGAAPGRGSPAGGFGDA